ncbi:MULTISPECIES: D-amino-acid transaminase [Aeribacillus]|uniref:D-alanine aminotransferase n=2 Tax=Aeribacillus TaxID=1055323 RepID=A0A165WGQ9_9BACI|nr:MULTISPECIES: D-amino-acid transaminase [Aeribacillus]KZN94960.1 amino acid aminotransferase [Aeribacillus pallidus]MDR9796242.1 D-amino-acid transaminase [Aeribacillus pallidus]MED0703125.1 D-amino-acid transaminase [Aeribacillus composti]MED0716932.1 D-amino-acid transaminase [Aeribacillus composti]MED0747082.1 D-amino-acid transaminase [Aeribacillus composti]
MSIGYVNGRFVDLNEPVIPIDERGHQFGDGVYEVIRVYNKKPFMLREHLERLQTSAEAIKLKLDQTLEQYEQLIKEAIEKSALTDCDVYLQITRGVAVRNHLFPDVSVSTTMTVRPAKQLPHHLRENGVSAIFHDDERWANCYIKSLNLLPNILAKQTAHEKGSYEAILVRDEYVTEGSSSNVFIVKNGTIYTTPLSKHILSGITRMAVKSIIETEGLTLVEEKFTKEDVLESDEVFITSTTSEILPIVTVDGQKIGTGKPGEIATTLYQKFQEKIANE